MTMKSLTACVEGVDHRLYQECFLSSPDLFDNPHTTATKCHTTLKFRRDNIQGEHKVFPCYKHLLQENYVEYKQTLQLAEIQLWITFQQDGAPPHWGSDVRRFLDATFPNRWIGRDGPKPWPPRSPDITLLFSFCGGMLRTKCFRHQLQILKI